MFDREDITTVIIKITAALGLVLMGIIFLLIDDSKPYLLGFFFGTLISILSLKLIEATSKRALDKPPDKAYSYTLKHYMLRFLLYAIVLGVAALADYLDFLMTVAGLLMVKLVITILTLVESFRKTE